MAWNKAQRGRRRRRSTRLFFEAEEFPATDVPTPEAVDNATSVAGKKKESFGGTSRSFGCQRLITKRVLASPFFLGRRALHRDGFAAN
jgi:hypothetical protein